VAVLPSPWPRAALLARLGDAREWDLAVIGGGSVGLGVALDAVARGFSVLLAEAGDFARGTSSRATKLAHGGVRYLAQGDLGLVREALHERGALLANAPHVAAPLPFVMPAYRWWEKGFYGAGLKAYDLLAGSRGLGATEWLDARRASGLLPGVRSRGPVGTLQGGVRYWDGQFDDARLAVLLARSAAERGALLINHAPVTALRRERGQVRGLVLRDAETGTEHRVAARCVVNATGVWVDGVTALDHDDDAPPAERPPRVAPSQGVHLVVDRAFMPASPAGAHALLVPKTDDGRVLFAVPWLGKTVLGTTDTPRTDAPLEPTPRADEVAFILREAGRYLARAPGAADVRSVWVGLRPLVKPAGGADGDTKAISREHTVWVARSGLVSVTGGKWTTYRAMAEDVLARCMAAGLLPQRPAGVTASLRLVGAPAVGSASRSLAAPPGEHLYGSEAEALRALPGATNWLAFDAESGAGILSEAMVRFAVRHEFARCTEDVLARRSRLLFLDAAQAAAVAPAVAAVVAEETGRDPALQAFGTLAAGYARLP
jgi:glycerol-3-phosphate dehydrogenase